jgi:Leucine-rich repeat (LRR) protein
LARIQGMKRVTNLNLSQTQITNACLEHLKTLPELRMVFVARTKLTPDDLKKFMAELPKAKFMP